MDNKDEYTLDYAPSAVQHLGVGLYKQLPQALIELITNCWDADATKVTISINYTQRSISVSDNGNGMSHTELNDDFLRVARNRRTTSQSGLSPNGRKVTGKKGLGKLALFGIANRIQVFSIKDGLENGFEMDFNVIQNTDDDKKYHPLSLVNNKQTDKAAGTTIIISDLTLMHITLMPNLVNSLSKRFDKYSKESFLVTIQDEENNVVYLDESAFEKSVQPDKTEFTYIFPKDFTTDIKNNNALKELTNRGVTGTVFTRVTPLPSSRQGFSILSRGKLASERSVNQFSERANDNFYSYTAGYFDIDFIDDDIKNDFISTDRQAILWNSTEDLIQLRENLNQLIGLIQRRWRNDRKNQKKKKAEKTIKSNDTAKRVLESPNITENDKKLIEETTDILEGDNIAIPNREKKELLDLTSKSTDTYKANHSVYKELIPANFEVPQTINSKTRRLREEMDSAATDESNSDKFILTQGLLLRALLDTTTSSLLVKYREEINQHDQEENPKIFKKKKKDPKSVYDLSFNDKFRATLLLLDNKKMLSNSKSAQTLEGEFTNLQVTTHLDQLMHDDQQWPHFETLKSIWDFVCPILLSSFELIKKE